MFSYGIVLCQIIARIVADPDDLPRTRVSKPVCLVQTWPVISDLMSCTVVWCRRSATEREVCGLPISPLEPGNGLLPGL